MDSCCRICSRSDDFRRFPLFAVADVSQEVIAKMLTSCTDTQVSSEDGLPQQICPDCLITLSLAYSFRRLCRRSDAKFRESFEAAVRTPSVTAEHMAHQRRSQSQTNEDSAAAAAAAYDSVPVIKEEVEFYEYECNAPPLEDQWVIQNPRTIQEGPPAGVMAVLHGAGQYEGDDPEDDDGRDFSTMVPMVTMDDTHDPAEYGESSGTAQRKKKPEPERFSKRIRRQEGPILYDGTLGADPSQYLVAMPDRTDLLEEIITPDGQQLVINPAQQQQRCEYCKKKMKKPYKHRNGKCMEPKGKIPSRPRCPYCHIVFVRSTSIPGHVQNSCRVYRDLCETSQELPEPSDNVTTTPVQEPVQLEAPPVKVKNNSKTVDVKPILQKTKPKASLICRYCYMSFTKRTNLVKHQRAKCRVLNELEIQRLTQNLSAQEPSIADSTTDATEQEPEPEPEPEPEQPQSQQQQPDTPEEEAEETTCVYCTQSVGKKTRFQHHNGRCVLGRANAEHPCPYCDAAYSSRSNLLRHQRDHCQKYREEQTTDITLTNAFKDLPVEGDTTQEESSLKEADSTPCKKGKKPKPPPKEEKTVKKRKKLKVVERVTGRVVSEKASLRPITKEQPNFVCSYCRKAFAVRDTLIEHQRSCTARKLHKQVKCQFCGTIISNRGNLRKHQKVYCKQAPRVGDVKVEQKEPIQKTVSKPKMKKVKVSKHIKKVIKKEKTKNGSVEQEVKELQVVQKSEVVSEPKDQKKKRRGGKANNIPCQNCSKVFQNKLQLRKHSLVCSRKMYKCKSCSAAFTNQSNLCRHVRLKRCRTDSPNTTLENGFQSDSPTMFSSTVNEPTEEDFEMILPESLEPETLPERPASELTENNNSLDDGKTDASVEEQELVHPEAILYTEEVELQAQPSVDMILPDQPPEPEQVSTREAEQH